MRFHCVNSCFFRQKWFYVRETEGFFIFCCWLKMFQHLVIPPLATNANEVWSIFRMRERERVGDFWLGCTTVPRVVPIDAKLWKFIPKLSVWDLKKSHRVGGLVFYSFNFWPNSSVSPSVLLATASVSLMALPMFL